MTRPSPEAVADAMVGVIAVALLSYGIDTSFWKTLAVLVAIVLIVRVEVME